MLDRTGFIDYRWLLLVLVVAVVAAGAGFAVGQWLGR